MKKNIYKILAAAFALSLVMTSPVASITSHATEDGLGFNGADAIQEDQTSHGAMPDDYWSSNSSDSGSSNNSSNDNYVDNSYTDSGSSDSGSDNSYVDNSYTDNSYTDNSYTDNSYVDNSYVDNSYADNGYVDNSYNDNSYNDNSYVEPTQNAVTEPTVVEEAQTYVEPIQTEQITAESESDTPVTKEVKEADVAKTSNRKTEKTTNVSDKDGKLVYGKYTYVISKSHMLCSVYYDGKYMGHIIVIDSEGNIADIDSITIEEDRNGDLNMDISVDKEVEAAKVVVTKACKTSDYSVSKAIGVRTISVNGIKVTLVVKIVQSLRANIK